VVRLHQGSWLEAVTPVNEHPIDERAGGWRQVSLYIACYLLWFGFSACTIWTILQFRNAMLRLLPVVGPWNMGAVDKFGLLLIALIALVWIFFVEAYLRGGVEANTFWPRVLRVTLIQLLVLGVAYGFQLLPNIL
jgi:hypothetical protein